ncbi:MAG TPA: hypothetical protein VMF30_05295 [Pirellulales bacterium]|nr:hypothetical protein [Pirellulales bacterium]
MALENDRAIAVLGAALLDEALTNALKQSWRNDGAKRTANALDTLLRDGGALSFRVKIDLAYLTGLIGPETHADLTIIKNIRNKFAHALVMDGNDTPTVPLTFRVQKIHAWCDNLNMNRRVIVHHPTGTPGTSPRIRFVLAVSAYASSLQTFADGDAEALDGYLSH